MQLNNYIIFLFPYCWRQSPKYSFIIKTGAHNNDYNIMPPVLECKWVTFTILGALLMGVKLGIKDCCALFKNSTLFVTPHWSLYMSITCIFIPANDLNLGMNVNERIVLGWLCLPAAFLPVHFRTSYLTPHIFYILHMRKKIQPE